VSEGQQEKRARKDGSLRLPDLGRINLWHLRHASARDWMDLSVTSDAPVEWVGDVLQGLEGGMVVRLTLVCHIAHVDEYELELSKAFTHF
jgi:hypothetical protein